MAIAAGSKYRSTVLSQVLKRITLQSGTTESSNSLFCCILPGKCVLCVVGESAMVVFPILATPLEA